jgi:rod shape-determining protein MreC
VSRVPLRLSPLTRPAARSSGRSVITVASRQPERDRTRRTHTALMLSVLTALTIMTVDAAGGRSSPVEPARTAAAHVFGPLEQGAAAVASPVVSTVQMVGEMRTLRAENEALHQRNEGLSAQLATTEVERNRLAQYDALAGISEGTSFSLVPARVVAIGPAQAFARTVTIDAGTADGVHADLTVVSGAGLVGRVVRAGRHTATVLLAVDAGSVIGGRLDSSMELGFLRGNGSLGADGKLSLELVDPDAVPVEGDTVVTWGSRRGVPYVAGVPVGEVTEVRASAGDQSVTAQVQPFADMSALDLVGVVTGSRDGNSRTVGRAAVGPLEGTP